MNNAELEDRAERGELRKCTHQDGTFHPADVDCGCNGLACPYDCIALPEVARVLTVA